MPSTEEPPTRQSRATPGPRLPLQVLGCGTGSMMVLEATWEDSGFNADSSAASGCGGSLSVMDRVERRGTAHAFSLASGSSYTLGTMPCLIPSYPFHTRGNRLRKQHTPGKISLAATEAEEEWKERSEFLD